MGFSPSSVHTQVIGRFLWWRSHSSQLSGSIVVTWTSEARSLTVYKRLLLFIWIFFIYINPMESTPKGTFLEYISFEFLSLERYFYIIHLSSGLQKSDTSQVLLLYPQGRITGDGSCIVGCVASHILRHLGTTGTETALGNYCWCWCHLPVQSFSYDEDAKQLILVLQEI